MCGTTSINPYHTQAGTGGYPNTSPGYYPNTNPFWPSHVTHSWQSFGPNPMDALAKAMDRLAAAIEKQNELAAK